MNCVVRGIVTFLYKIKYRLSFEGVENIPREGGYVYASNHRSYYDPVFITMKVPTPMTYMAKEELFRNPVAGWFIKRLGAFAVKRGSGDMEVINTAINKLKEGKNLVIFPEGTRSYDGRVGKGKTGVAMIAAMSGVDVIPVGICFEGAKIKWGTRIVIKYGRRIPASELVFTGTSPKELKGVKKRIMDEIRQLAEGNTLPEEASISNAENKDC